jgi:hypothetical protein
VEGVVSEVTCVRTSEGPDSLFWLTPFCQQLRPFCFCGFLLYFTTLPLSWGVVGAFSLYSKRRATTNTRWRRTYVAAMVLGFMLAFLQDPRAAGQIPVGSCTISAKCTNGGCVAGVDLTHPKVVVDCELTSGIYWVCDPQGPGTCSNTATSIQCFGNGYTLGTNCKGAPTGLCTSSAFSCK